MLAEIIILLTFHADKRIPQNAPCKDINTHGCQIASRLLRLFLKVLDPLLIIGNYNASGWTSLACIIIFLGGLQLFSIGIVGQYIARIFLETKRRPLFIVSESSEDEGTDAQP